MDSRTEERVKDWDSRPFSDGYEDLRDLADAEFSGAVETGSTTAFMLNGRIVGVVGGDVESFDGASGTTYEAPHPSLPLLFAMREQGGDERAKYYTNDTPVSEADDTLTDGSFTGYIELSENVLSGDYYVVYYGGRSMSCAFVGTQETLVTDDDAFDRADDEVGIYTVWDVDVEVEAVPGGDEPEEADDAADPADGTTAAGGAGADAADAGGTVGAGGTHDAVDASGPRDSVEQGGTRDGPSEEVSGGVDAAGTSRESTTTRDTRSAEAGESRSAEGRGTRSSDRDVTAAGGTEAVRSDDDRPGATGGADEPVAAPPPDESEPNGGGTDPAVDEREPGSQRARRDDPEEGTPTRGDSADPEAAESDRGDGPPAGTGPGGEKRARAARTGEHAGTDGRRATSSDATPAGRNAPDDGNGTTGQGEGADDEAMAEVPDEVMAEVENEAYTGELADEAAWRETTTIPSISPDRTTENDDQDPLAAGSDAVSGSTADAESAPEAASNAAGGGGRTRTPSTEERARREDSSRATAVGGDAQPAGADPARVTELENDLLDLREERDELAARSDELVRERDELVRERDELAARNDELSARVDALEDEVAALEAELATARERLERDDTATGSAGVALTPREALAGTNLFVRYGSKSGTTLEDVHDRDISVADLEANLRLEYHTGFDAGDAVVDGQAYDEFLYDSTPYQFVEWFVYDLVFEIRDTGNESDLADLYEAFPKVDRIELYGDVSLQYQENGEEIREQTTFDVVVRDRMGNPLAVGNVNASRDPATEEMMVDLQERATRVKRTSETLAGAFMVTTSFFAPEALEIAEEATSGGLLSRDSKKSYVKLSRKRGYHLGLVETRNGEFHVNVPEL